MTYDNLKQLVNTLTYKPGTYFECRKATPHIPKHVIVIKIPVVDIRNQRSTYNFLSIYVDPIDDREEILSNLYTQLKRWELHEIDEFFQTNGISVVEPHPEVE